MVAIDDSASMLCARVMRGISSIENRLTPVGAICRMTCGSAERVGKANDRLPAAQRPKDPPVWPAPGERYPTS